VISGGGGAKLRPVGPHPAARFARATHGFVVVSANATELEIQFYDAALALLHRFVTAGTSGPAESRSEPGK
jgi:hypothetical protein